MIQNLKINRQDLTKLWPDYHVNQNFVHSTNTAAALWHKEQVQAIERLGISMYGLNPSGKTLELPFEIEPALSLVSELTHIKKIAAAKQLVTVQLMKQVKKHGLEPFQLVMLMVGLVKCKASKYW